MSDEVLDSAGTDDAGDELGEADCEETVHRLYNYLDGELTEERRLAIQAHLDDCGPCVDVMGFEAELRRVIADRCKDRVPEQLKERISQAIHHEQVAAGGGAPD
ncbi:MAG: anti-sigma factor [Acidimicrobiaceae bacterium]|jgi:mycothiol system anti-sigma-R factor|nr:anti-sigma factor [Acidimicrobiaceae bacterium]